MDWTETLSQFYIAWPPTEILTKVFEIAPTQYLSVSKFRQNRKFYIFRDKICNSQFWIYITDVYKIFNTDYFWWESVFSELEVTRAELSCCQHGVEPSCWAVVELLVKYHSWSGIHERYQSCLNHCHDQQLSIKISCYYLETKNVVRLEIKIVVRHFTANGVFGKFSQQTRKVSQQTSKVSQQTRKVSQQTGEVSQHLFAVKGQVTFKILLLQERRPAFLFSRSN